MKHLITTYTRAILLMALMLIMPSALWADKEAYVQYADSTLTFRYDENRASYDTTYVLPESGKPAWIGSAAKRVVFNEAFAQVHPKSLAKWFDELKKLTDITGLEYLNTDSATDMSNMFYYCKSLTKLDLSHFCTERVTTMEGMFMGCEQLTELNITSFSTQQVKTMYAMFRNCMKLTTLDLTSFDTQKVTDMRFMFCNGTALTHIYASKRFVTSQVKQSLNMFTGCTLLPNFDSKCTDITNVKAYLTYPQPWAEFQFATKTLTFHYDSRMDRVTATDKNYLPAAGEDPGWIDCDIYYVVFDTNFAKVRPKRCYKWFYNLKHFFDIRGLENLCTDSVNDMSYMFYGCPELTSLDLRSFNTEHVTTMTNMFMDCTSLTELNLSSFDTKNVNDMSEMFRYCEQLTSLDLTSFDTQTVTNMDHMFRDSKRLTNIYVSDSFVTDQVTRSYLMFQTCDALPNYQYASENDKTYAHYKAGGYLTLRRHFTVGDNRYNVDGYDSPTCYTDVTFTDGEAYNAPCDFTFSSDNTASYSRTTSNHWATLCLPFAFSADNSTARFYSVKSYADGNIAVTALTDTIAAGTPVLAYIADGNELSVTAAGAAAVDAPDTLNVLQGAFAQTKVADDDYIIANDHFWNASWLKSSEGSSAQHVYVAPYRASLTLTNLSTSAKPNSISIGEGETTGIISVTSLESLLDGAEIYDLQGRRLTAPNRGMMIVRKGGVSRKVVVR